MQPEPGRLASDIENGAVRALFNRFIQTYSGVHDDIRVQATSVEIRFFYQGHFLCRLSPYRELFHVQVGDNPGWETRVRDEGGLVDAIDRALQRFLQVYSGGDSRDPHL